MSFRSIGFGGRIAVVVDGTTITGTGLPGNPLVATAGAGMKRFGVFGEDDVASQNRSFNTNGFDFSINNGGDRSIVFDASDNTIKIQTVDSGPVTFEISLPTTGLRYLRLVASDTPNNKTGLIYVRPDGSVYLAGQAGASDYNLTVSTTGIFFGKNTYTNTLVYAASLPNTTTANVLYYDTSTGQITYGSAPGASITADNGLTANTSTNVRLGGTLLQNTTITNAGFGLTVTNNTGQNTFIGVNSSTGIAIYGSASSGIGIQGESNSNYAIFGFSASGIASLFNINPSSTNTIATIMLLQRNTTGTGANGIGGSIEFNIETSVQAQLANQLISKWTDATDASRVSEMIFTGVNAGTLADLFTIKGNGQLRGHKYGINTFGGTPDYAIGVDANGNLVEFTPGGGSSAISDLTVATATNTIDNGNYKQEWQWNSLSGNNGLVLSSSSTAASGFDNSVLHINTVGANSNSYASTTGISSVNQHSGTGSANIAGDFYSGNGDYNYGIVVGVAGSSGANPEDNAAVYAYNFGDKSIGFYSAPSVNNGQTVYGIYASFVGSPTTGSTSIAAYLRARWGATNYALITDGGLVGIGTTTPTQLLHVNNGNVKIQGGQLILETQFTPASDTDTTYPEKTITADDTYLYYRKSDGTWVKKAWDAL